MANLPTGQLVPNEDIDSWIVAEIGSRGPLWASELAYDLPMTHADPDGQMRHALRAIDRGLQRLRKANKIRIAQIAGRPRWELVQ